LLNGGAAEDRGETAGGGVRLHVLRISVVALPLLVYLLTLCPTIGPGDGAELATSGALLGVSHPTGYPLYTLISRLFVAAIPWGTAAAKVNVVSAVFAALALFFLFEVLRTRLKSGWSAWLACLALAFSRSWWLSSVTAEVYAMGAFFLTLLLWMGLGPAGGSRSRVTVLCAYVFGVALTHHVTILLAAPFVLLSIFPDLRRDRRLVLVCLTALLVPLTLYAYIPIRAGLSPPFVFGDARGWSGLWRHLTASGYRGNLLPAGWETLVSGARSLPGYLGEGIPVFLIWAPFLGMIDLWRRRVRLLGWLVVLAGPYLVFSLAYAIPDISAYFLPVHVVLAVLAAAGFRWILEMACRAGGSSSGGRARLPRVAASLALAGAVSGVFFWNLPWCDRNHHRIAEAYGRALLDTAERMTNGRATLFALGDHAVFPLAYLQRVEHRAPRVTVYDQSGTILDDVYGDRGLEGPSPDRSRRAAIEREIVAESPGSVFFSQREKVASGMEVPVRPVGLLFQPRAQPLPSDVQESLWGSYEFPDMRDPHLYADISSRVIGGVYFQQAALVAIESGDALRALEAVRTAGDVAADVAAVQARQIQLYLSLGDRDGAVRSAREAVRLLPGSPWALNNLGSVYALVGRWEEAKAVLQGALRMAPDFAAARANLGSVSFGIGRPADAVADLERALTMDPSMVNARYNLALALWKTGKPEEATVQLSRLLEVLPRHEPSLRLIESLQNGGGIPPGAAMRLTFTY